MHSKVVLHDFKNHYHYFQKRIEQLKGGDKINVMSLYGDYNTFSTEEQQLSQLILQKAAYNISIPENMILNVKKKWENFSGIGG